MTEISFIYVLLIKTKESDLSSGIYIIGFTLFRLHIINDQDMMNTISKRKEKQLVSCQPYCLHIIPKKTPDTHK